MITSVARPGAPGQPLRAPAGLGLRPLGPGQGPFRPCCPLRSWAPDLISALIAVARPQVPLRPRARSSRGWLRTAGPAAHGAGPGRRGPAALCALAFACAVGSDRPSRAPQMRPWPSAFPLLPRTPRGGFATSLLPVNASASRGDTVWAAQGQKRAWACG